MKGGHRGQPRYPFCMNSEICVWVRLQSILNHKLLNYPPHWHRGNLSFLGKSVERPGMEH